jgi:ribosomal protein L13E
LRRPAEVLEEAVLADLVLVRRGVVVGKGFGLGLVDRVGDGQQAEADGK